MAGKRRRIPLTIRKVRSLEPSNGKATRLWDADVKGLHVKVTPTGEKSWFFYYRSEGKQHCPKLGSFPTMTVDQAREAARIMAGDVAKGANPASERQRQRAEARKAVTVARLCDLYVREYAKRRKRPASARNDELNLNKHVVPALGAKRVREIERPQIVTLITEIGKDTPIAANRVRALLSTVFGFAEDKGFRELGSNPVKRIPRFEEKPRERFLNPKEAERFGEALAAMEDDSGDAIRLLAFTGARTSEILSLRWSQWNRKDSTLTVDSKTGIKTVFLNRQAQEILSRRFKARSGSGFAFPGRQRRRPLRDIRTPWERLRMASDVDNFTPHDLRHNFATVARVLGIDKSDRERLLGHAVQDISDRYAHMTPERGCELAQTVGDAIEKAFG